MNFYLKAFFITAILSALGYFIHDALVQQPGISLFVTYLYFGTATFLTVSALKFTVRVAPDNLGYVFLGLMFVKLGGVLIFFPELTSDEVDLGLRQLLGFLAAYFLFLFAEIGIVLKWLNDS